MYSFQAQPNRRKSRQLIRLLSVIIFLLLVALIGVGFVYARSARVGDATSSALLARALSESTEAQSAIYRLTQSSGTNTMSLLSAVRSHIYALQCLNGVASNIYGPGAVLCDGELLTACLETISQCEVRIQAGSVLTDLTTQLRDQVDAVVAAFGAAMP